MKFCSFTTRRENGILLKKNIANNKYMIFTYTYYLCYNERKEICTKCAKISTE